MTKTKAVVFDFDGTLANSFDVIVRIFQQSSKHKTRVTPQQLERLRNMSARQVIKELHIAWWRVPWLIYKGRREMTRHLNEVELFTGLQNEFEKLIQQNCELYILSSNSSTNINKFLTTHHISQFFKKTYGGAGIFGKKRALQKLLVVNRLAKENVIYLGDEVRDIEAAKKAGIKIIAVTWGFNSAAILERSQPDFIANQVTDISKIII